ncbi:triose-phosphate isomerase [Erysipelotrichaceae bacterium OH741_COT-311]|nr:triose-phosphate isomerase [Erysipelotrichaceae bacterium OH741_COT-311]
MRKPFIVGNWKMNKTIAETVEFVTAIEKELSGNEACTYGIGAPFTALKDAKANAKNLVIAAENVHFEASGAYTGEISIPMLKELGVTHVIIGHSERRQMFNETDEALAKKAKALFDADMTPIFCIGESEAQYDANETEAVIRRQLTEGLKGLCPHCASKLVIAYEPIWAIGTGKSATKEIAQNCCAIVRDQIKVMFNQDVADKVIVQYGGSVKPENIKEYMACEDIDGALIGGASLKVDSFKAIIDATK